MVMYMHSLSDQYLSELKFNSEQASILRAIGEYRGKQALFFKQSPETLETLRMVAKIESSESSNRLEGIELPHKKIEELVLKDTAPISRSEFAYRLIGFRARRVLNT